MPDITPVVTLRLNPAGNPVAGDDIAKVLSPKPVDAPTNAAGVNVSVAPLKNVLVIIPPFASISSAGGSDIVIVKVNDCAVNAVSLSVTVYVNVATAAVVVGVPISLPLSKVNPAGSASAIASVEVPLPPVIVASVRGSLNASVLVSS